MPDRPYINEHDCFLILRRPTDPEAARELELRAANRARYWHDVVGWPRWERPKRERERSAA